MVTPSTGEEVLHDRLVKVTVEPGCELPVVSECPRNRKSTPALKPEGMVNVPDPEPDPGFVTNAVVTVDELFVVIPSSAEAPPA